MKKYLPIILSPLIVLVLAGCIYVTDADQEWNDGQTDIALIGTWTGTNGFKFITIENSDDHLIISVQPPDSAGPPVSNIIARTTRILGVDALIIKDIWGFVRQGLRLPSRYPDGTEYPVHFAHGYLLIPYRLQDGTLTFLSSVQWKVIKLIEEKSLDAFLPAPPPARDWSPPVFARLDSSTISALKEQIPAESFWEKQEYKNCKRSVPRCDAQSTSSPDP